MACPIATNADSRAYRREPQRFPTPGTAKWWRPASRPLSRPVKPRSLQPEPVEDAMTTGERLSACKEQLLSRWEALASAEGQPEPALRAIAPTLLDVVADALVSGKPPAADTLRERIFAPDTLHAA